MGTYTLHQERVFRLENTLLSISESQPCQFNHWTEFCFHTVEVCKRDFKTFQWMCLFVFGIYIKLSPDIASKSQN